MKKIFHSKKNLFVFGFVALMGLLYFVRPQHMNQLELTDVFTSPENHFSIKVDPDWTIFSTPDGINEGSTEKRWIRLFFSDNRTWGESPYGKVFWFEDEYTTMEQILKVGEEMQVFEKENGFTEREYSTSQYNGLLLEYTFQASPITVKTCREWYLIKNQQGYVVMICAMEKDWPDLEPFYSEIMESFTILP